MIKEIMIAKKALRMSMVVLFSGRCLVIPAAKPPPAKAGSVPKPLDHSRRGKKDDSGESAMPP